MPQSSTVLEPAYQLDGSYPGTCVRLRPLGWWPVALVLLLMGWPSMGLLSGMLRQVVDPASNLAVRVFVSVPLLAYLAWHSFLLLLAAYVWAGRLEFRVNVPARQVEVFRGVGRFGWTWKWGYEEVLGLERFGMGRLAPSETSPDLDKVLPMGGFTLKTIRKSVPWGFSLKGEEAQRLLELLKHKHAMFHPTEKDPLHS